MPRYVFGNKGQYETWIRDHVDTTPEARSRYEMLITSMFDVVMVPKVSTRPVVFAVYRGTNLEMNEMRRLAKELKIPMYEVRAVEWDTEKQVGVTVRR